MPSSRIERASGSNLPKFGQRHILVILGLFGFANVYAMRVNLSVAIVDMVDNSNSSKHRGETHFDWDENTQGNILGAFFYGYVLTQLPGGRMAELVGGKWLFGGGVLITSIFTLLTPIAAKQSIYLFYAVRVIEGLGEGVTFPATMAIIAKWATPEERSRFVSTIFAGSSLGTVISMPISDRQTSDHILGLLCDYVNWESVFYVFGVLGVVWFVFWAYFVYDSPEVHPRISQAEKQYIITSLIECESSKPSSIPWKAILTSAPVWAITATHVTQSNAFLSALPYLLMWAVSMSVSHMVDYVISAKTLSRDLARKLSNSTATLVPALALLGVAFSGHSKILSVTLLCAAVGANGFIYSGEMAAMIDIGNNFAGSLMGFINALGNTMGFIAPKVTVFLIAAGVYWIGNLVFLVYGSSDEQPWNRQTNVTGKIQDTVDSETRRDQRTLST